MTTTSSPTPVRSERFVNTLLGWYVRTREEIDLGPFKTQAEAGQALDRHVQSYRGIGQRAFSQPIQEGMEIHDPSSCEKVNCAVCMEARAFVAAVPTAI